MIKREESDSTVQLNDSLLSSTADQEAGNVQVNDSGIGSLKRRLSESSTHGKENQPGHNAHKRARKALASSWGAATSTPHAHTNHQPHGVVPDVSFIVETPSKTLAGDSSVLFSPPSIVKHSLLEESTSLHSDNTPTQYSLQEHDKTKVQHGYPTNILYTMYEPVQTVDINNVNSVVFRDITNLESPRSFARLNADRLRTITTANEIGDNTNLIAPKEVLANAFADHIYKVTNQKPSTSRIDEILSNKIMKNNDYSQKENQWWEKDVAQNVMQDENIYPNDYYVFHNNYVE
ncbi:hypothetical protein O0L34_g1718 [Tuta absoluta]|nr:hypothetical protein O0L34_g1718 [Tuta absoluta]